MSEGAPLFVRVNIKLRTSQAEYLAYLADRDETSLSRAFGVLVEAFGVIAAVRKPVMKRQFLFLATPAQLSVLDGLAAAHGLSRSDTARRLIDAAQADDPAMGE